MTIATLSVITKDDHILLGLKKQKLGAGKFNGFGGKLEVGESIAECMSREIREEVHLNIKPGDLEKVAIIDFKFTTKPEWNMIVHIFRATTYEGTPVETDEMKPQTFPIDQIPYEQMWSSDKIWLPLVLEGKKFTATFVLDENDLVIENKITFVSELI